MTALFEDVRSRGSHRLIRRRAPGAYFFHEAAHADDTIGFSIDSQRRDLFMKDTEQEEEGFRYGPKSMNNNVNSLPHTLSQSYSAKTAPEDQKQGWQHT